MTLSKMIERVVVIAIGVSVAYGVATYIANAVSSSLNNSAAMIERTTGQ